MVSSFALHHGNDRTCNEMLRIHPDEHPVSIQLFGPEPEAMRSAAATVAEAGADLIDLNMGCPVRKVVKTGAGAALLAQPERAVEVARAAAEGSGLPVTVKLRSGLEPGDRAGYELALRLAEDAGVAAIGFHPRPAAVHHKGDPDYPLAAELVAELRARGLECPVVISGGLGDAERARAAYERSGADAVMVARGGLGYPWIFEELAGSPDEAAVGCRGGRGAPLGARPGGGALGRGPRGAEPAEVLPLVSGSARGTRTGCGRIPADHVARRSAGLARRR